MLTGLARRMIVFWHSVKYVDCMKTLLHIVFVVAIGLSAHVAEAQDVTPQKSEISGGPVMPQVMSLHDCMEYAISNSTKVRIQEAASGDARLDRRDAALALFTPQISAQTYAYYNFGRSIDPQTNTYFNTTSFHNNYGVSAGYDLFDGFKAVNNYKISKTGMLIADSQEKQVEADICLAVMEAYYNVVYYKRLCDVYEEQVAVAEQALAKAKRQEELGQKGHADVIQMEADLADRQYDLTNTYNMYESQRMTLADLMFWPVDEELVIDTSMPAWQVEPVSTSSVVDFALEHNPAVDCQLAAAQRQAGTEHGQVADAALRWAVRRLEHELLHISRLPDSRFPGSVQEQRGRVCGSLRFHPYLQQAFPAFDDFP